MPGYLADFYGADQAVGMGGYASMVPQGLPASSVQQAGLGGVASLNISADSSSVVWWIVAAIGVLVAVRLLHEFAE